MNVATQLRLMVLLCLLWLAGNAAATTLVLVHGFLGEGHAWDESGVVQALTANGWQDGGYLQQGYQQSLPADAHRFYRVRLPWHDPISMQAAWLATAMAQVPESQQEQIILVAHSAGGVVARHWLVSSTDQTSAVQGLITIATPHLGTPWARVGQWIQQSTSPFWDWMGASQLARLDKVLSDLSPPANGNYLDWLNHQPHPHLAYVSIVRQASLNHQTVQGDVLVPPRSQNMNWVPTLAGRSMVMESPGNHLLNQRDAQWIQQAVQAIGRYHNALPTTPADQS